MKTICQNSCHFFLFFLILINNKNGTSYVMDECGWRLVVLWISCFTLPFFKSVVWFIIRVAFQSDLTCHEPPLNDSLTIFFGQDKLKLSRMMGFYSSTTLDFVQPKKARISKWDDKEDQPTYEASGWSAGKPCRALIKDRISLLKSYLTDPTYKLRRSQERFQDFFLLFSCDLISTSSRAELNAFRAP